MIALRQVVVVAAMVTLGCSKPAENLPSSRLGNPVLDARAALAAGDVSLLAIADDTVLLPGLEGTGVSVATERRFRVFSARTLGVNARRWQAQRDSLTTYAAAYNRLVFEGRAPRITERSPMPDKGQGRHSADALALNVHDIDDGSVPRPAPTGGPQDRLGDTPTAPPVVRLCNLILASGLRADGDELRILGPTAEGADVQVHRKESWLAMMRVPAPAQAPLINRLKSMANLDAAKRPLQKGTLKVRLEGEVFSLAIEIRLRGDVEEVSLRLPTHSAEPTPGPA